MLREDPPDYYTAKATWFPEACRLFVNWWLHTFAFPKFYRKLYTPEEVESSILYGNPRLFIIDARRPGNYLNQQQLLTRR